MGIFSVEPLVDRTCPKKDAKSFWKTRKIYEIVWSKIIVTFCCYILNSINWSYSFVASLSEHQLRDWTGNSSGLYPVKRRMGWFDWTLDMPKSCSLPAYPQQLNHLQIFHLNPCSIAMSNHPIFPRKIGILVVRLCYLRPHCQILVEQFTAFFAKSKTHHAAAAHLQLGRNGGWRVAWHLFFNMVYTLVI